MSVDQLRELAHQTIQMMNAGDFEGALDLAYRIRSRGSDYIVSYTVSGLLIDIGVGLCNEEVVKEGVELLQKDLETIISHNEYPPSAYYNLANGYGSLFNFKTTRDPYVACFNKTELNQAKVYYRKALRYDMPDDMRSLVLTNLGNCFDELGRVIDALECYEKSLGCNPNHGMALGNKGLALMYYAALAGEHQRTILLEAYSLLSRALKLRMPPENVNTFSKYLEDIEKMFPDKEILDNPPTFPGYSIKAGSEFEKFLVEFCSRNKLYLNICNFCQRCDAAIGDTAVIKKMIVKMDKGRDQTSLKENPYLRLSAYLNQIKEDYVTARFLLILSRYKGLDLSFVDKHVRIIDTHDSSRHNIYIQFVKASFRNFYDILDKIASFINDYLKLGIPKTQIDFSRIWYSNSKTGKIRQKIKRTRNFSLNALFDIHRDFKKGPYKKLQNTRNALTHRFVNIRFRQESEDEENMTEKTLIRQTVELAGIVRSAIIYLLYFVDVEERKKEATLKGIQAPRIFAQELPNSLKTRT